MSATFETALKLVGDLRARGLTCATAESCTGGGIGAALTAVPGSSAVYKGGVVSYANEVKRDLLGVPGETLARVGAVSRETACAMAQGVRSLLKSDLAVSVTGIAGPDGGSPEKPVGLVWFAVASQAAVEAHVRRFAGDREAVRAQAVDFALSLLAGACEKERGAGE